MMFDFKGFRVVICHLLSGLLQSQGEVKELNQSQSVEMNVVIGISFCF